MGRADMENNKFLLIQSNDNVAVALSALAAGTECEIGGKCIVLRDDIPAAHKVALKDFAPGEDIIKYGLSIGHATKEIHTGEHVHIHNVLTNLDGLLEYGYEPVKNVWADFIPEEEAWFDGYLREDGKAGTRNELWIIPTVGCVNRTAQILAEQGTKRYAGRLDGVRALTHNAGCSQLGDDMLTTQKLLKGLINNPNAGAVLVVSLGCENNCLEYFKPVLGEVDPRRVKFLVTQEHTDEYAEGLRLLDELADYAAGFRRQRLSAGLLQIGLKCGSSDAFSGVSANPLCGRITDRVVKCGGKGILTEVSEMFGAETRLMERAESREVFEGVVGLINDFKAYFMRYGQPIDRNPCPGNIRSGISTDEDKSLGNIQKGGHAPVVDVLYYGDQAEKRGLSLLIGSGNDAVSVTNMTASGANLILFTTGNGNPFGAFVPTIKISSNTALSKRKPDWIDFNAGCVLDGESFESASERLFQYILRVASGREQTKSEKFGYQEISIFRDGVIL
jgi:altronate hydrolase